MAEVSSHLPREGAARRATAPANPEGRCRSAVGRAAPWTTPFGQVAPVGSAPPMAWSSSAPNRGHPPRPMTRRGGAEQPRSTPPLLALRRMGRRPRRRACPRCRPAGSGGQLHHERTAADHRYRGSDRSAPTGCWIGEGRLRCRRQGAETAIDCPRRSNHASCPTGPDGFPSEELPARRPPPLTPGSCAAATFTYGGPAG